MNCPSCKIRLSDNVEVCPNCRANIKNLEQNKTVNYIDTDENNNIGGITQSNNETKKPNKIRKYLLIILLTLIIITGVKIYNISNVKHNNKYNSEQISSTKEEINTIEKLKNDYENNIIDINKYFSELVYYEYDSSKLDENYKSDKGYYLAGCQSKLLKLLEFHKNELDTNIVREYVKNVTLYNVALGDDTTVQTQSNITNKYELKLLDNKKEEKNSIVDHRLNKVILSRNENFLIWYTDVGSDAITEEQLQQISNGLENTLSKFEKTFGVKYSYFPYKDSLFNEDYKNAKEVLKKNEIPITKINSAMSVYIYDTGSEDVLAYYTQPYGSHLILDLVVQLGLKDNDGIVTFPYIVLNKRGFSNENESLKQLYAHELFHHFQYLFCRTTTGKICVDDDYAEGTANLASAVAIETNSTNNYLNGWSGIYTKNADMPLERITNGSYYGYGTFPYLYVYSEIVDNGFSVLMNAHNETNPFQYIKNYTEKEDFIKISERLTYGILSKNFENKVMYSKENVTIKEVIDVPKEVNETINPGAIIYYEISGNNTVTVISGNNDSVGLKFYGYKDGIYTELMSSMDRIEFDLTYYVRYDKFYIAVYNADITNVNTYKIKVRNSDFAENDKFNTTFNNYNIEIEMNINIAGVTTKTISKGVMDEQHQKEYLDVTTTSMGIISLKNKMYHDFNVGCTYMTQPYGGDVWWKEKSASQIVDLNNVLKKLISMKNVTKVADNHYKVKMAKEDVNGLVTFGNSSVPEIGGDVYIDVYTENGYITMLEYDFTKMVKGFEKFTAVVKCSNYDNAGDVEIPQSIIDNAKTQ